MEILERSSPISHNHFRILCRPLAHFDLNFLTFLDHLLVQGRPLYPSSSILDIGPCLQSAGISSCLPLCCHSISFSVDLCSFSPKLPDSAISHRCGWVLVPISGQTTLVFFFLGKFQQILRAPPSWCLHF